MVLKTNKYRLEYFEQGSPYYLDSERRRFTILDLQINSILKQFSDGIISGFSVSKNALNSLTIDVSDGLALVPTFVPGVENGQNIVEKSNIAVRSFKTTSLTLESFQSYLIYLVPLIDEQNSDEIVVMADNNVFRNATTTESGENAYSQYLIDLPSIDINNDNVTVYVNGRRYLGPHSFNGQYLVFPNKRIETDTVQVRVVPKDSLALAIIETGNNNILSIDESVKVFVSSSQEGKSIPQALVAHNHRDDGTELSLPKIKLTSKTKIITGTMVPPDSSDDAPNTIYIFQKVDEDDINGFVDTQFNSDFKSFSGTISSDNIRFDELINLQNTENILYNGYFINPDISQKNSSKIISTNNDGKNIVSEDILSNLINIIKEDKYNYIIYPYEVILFINGLRQYNDFWLVSDNNETIKIKFSSPLSDSDIVQVQLNLITELNQVKGLLKTDALSSYSKKDVNAFFSASNINDGYLSPEMIPRISHIGRSNELLIPIPSESEDITKSLGLIYCETTDRKNYRPWLNNVPPLKNVKHINKIDETWYVCANHTLISSGQERLFGDISVANNYREDSPIPLKTDYVGNSEENNIVPILLTEKTVLSRTETGWKTLATTPNFSSNASLYKKDDDQYAIPGTYKFYDLEVDHISDNIFITCSISASGNPTEIYAFANKNINSGIDTWTKAYSNLNGNIKDIVVHNGYLYAIIRIDGVDNVLKTMATPSNVISQTGNVITIDANDEDNFVVGGTLVISRSDSASEFLIVGIETNDTVSRITINRPPNITLDPSEDLIFPGWASEVNALESSYDKLFSIGGQIYATSGSILFSGFVPIIASNVVFNTIYSMSLLDEYVVISTDTGIYYLQSTFYSYAYGYGWGAGAGIDFFDVFGSVGTHFGYGGGDFELVYANLYAYGYGFELRKSGIWVKIYNSTFDTAVNTSVESTNHLYSFEYNDSSGKEELYLSCDDGVFQIESVGSPYDISIRNAFTVLGKPIDHIDNVFTNNFLSGSVISYNSTTKYLTVKCNLRNVVAGDTIVFDESSGGVNGNKEFRILNIINNNSIENLYDIRIDRFDGKFTKDQKINSGNKFRTYPHSDPLVFINNNPQSTVYNKFFQRYSFSFHSQKITFDSALSPSDVVTAISQIKHFYALRGTWDAESLISKEKLYLNNKYVSILTGTWEDISIVEYNDFSTSNKVLIKEIILETNHNAFFGFNLSGIQIIPNTNNPEETYTISSNSWNSIRIRSDNPESLQESILTNSTDDSEETISNVSFSIDIGIDLTNSIEVLPFGNIGLVSLPSPVLTNTVARISIPSTNQFGKITHEDIQDALSKHEDGLPHKFSGIKNSNLLQYIAALDNIMNVFDIVSFENLEIDDLSSDRVIDLINSTIENSKLYEQDDAGDYSRYVFNIIYSSDLGGTFALTDKGVYFKPDSTNSTEKWVKKANVVQYMNVSGSPTIPSEFKGLFIGYDNDSDTWTISWGENFRLEERNNGLDNHHITAIDLDPNDSEVVYFSTRQHGIYRTTDGGTSEWETVFHPGAFDSQNNINNFRYEFSDFKVSGSKNYVMFALMKNSSHGGLYVSNDDGSNFEKHELDAQVVGAIGNDDYNFINIPRIQDGSDLGISPIVYWGSNNLYRKQYSYGYGFANESATNGILTDTEGHVTNSPARWKIDIINRQIIDSSSKSDFRIYDIAIRESNTSHLFLATSNGLYKSVHDGQVLSGTINDYRYIGNQGSSVFSPLDFTGDETIDHTKLWVTFDVSVPEEIFQSGKYFKLWEKPLKLISAEKISSTQVLLYFEYFDPRLYVFYPGNGFDNHTKGYNVRGFSSWNKIGQEPFKINNPKKLLLHNDILYVGTDGRGVFYSTDLGNTFAELNNGFVDLIADENLKISAFDVDSNDVIYCSSLDMGLFGGGVFKYVNGEWNRIGGNYTGDSSDFTITDGLTKHNVTSFKVSQSNTSVIYAGTSSGAFKTSNGGTSWTSISLPTEYDNVARFFSDKKTAFLGTQFSGILKTRNKGNLWYQDFNPEEQNIDKIRNTKNWRIWDLRYSGLSDDSERNLYVNVYRNIYSPSVGISYLLESLNNNYVTQQNPDSELIQIFEDTRKPIYIGQTVAGTTATRITASANLKETSYYEFSGSYPGILETFLYNSENQSFIANITTDGARFLPYNHLLNSQTSNPPILFKHQDSINDYRRIFGLLLDHTAVNYIQFDGNQTSTLMRSGLFQETKEYDISRNDIKNIVSDISTKSNVSEYSICDVIKHPSLNRYYVATENHGVFQADNIPQMKPTNFYRGLGTLGTSSTKLTDSRTNFSTNSPIGSTVYLISNTASGDIIDSKTITSLDGNNTVVFSTSTATNGEDYFYVITDRKISNINSHTNYNLAINNPTLISGDYYDVIEDSNNSFSTADVDVKIYPFDIENPSFSNTFVVSSVSDGLAYVKRHRLSFRNDGETRLLFYDVSYNPTNEETVVYFQDFYRIEESASSWVGMLLQPNINESKFYKIKSVNSETKSFSITDTNGSIYDEISPLLLLNSTSQIYSNVYFSLFNSIADLVSSGYVLFDFSSFNRMNTGLSYFESEYLDDKGFSEIDLKFNKLYFESPILYAATEMGVWKYDTSSLNPSWTEINSGISNLSVKDIIGDNGTNLFAASYGGGVFRSTNSGLLWTDISTSLNHKKVWSISIDPNDSDNLIAGTKNGGVYRTTNATATTPTWTDFNASIDRKDIQIWNVKATSNNPNLMYAWAYGAGVFVSTNAGSNWNQINNGLTNLKITDLDIFSLDSNKVVVSTDGAGLFEYIGTKWTKIKTNNLPHPVISRLAISKTNINTMFVIVSKTGPETLKHIDNTGIFKIYNRANPQSVYKTTDNGKTWKKVFELLNPDDSRKPLDIDFDQNNNVLISSKHHVYFSDNDGETFVLKTDIDKINSFKNTPLSIINSINVNPNQSRNVNLIGTKTDGANIVYISQDGGKTYRASKIGDQNYDIYDLTSTTISKLSTTQDIAISQFVFDSSATITKAEYINNAKWTQMTVQYGPSFQSYLNADFGGGLLSVSGDSKRFNVLNKPNDISSDNKTLFVDGKLDQFSGSQFKIDGLYSLSLTISENDYLIDNSMVNNYIKIKTGVVTNICKIVRYILSGTTATIVFADNTESITTGSFTDAVITIGSLSSNGKDVDDVAIIYSPYNGNLIYSMNYGYYWISPSTLQNNGSNIETDKPELQAIVNGQDFTKSSLETLSFEIKDNILFRSYLEDDVLKSEQLFTYSNVIRSGLSRSFNNASSVLYITTTSNVYSVNSTLATSSSLTGLPSVTEIQKPFKVSPSAQNTCLFFADNILYTTTDLTTWNSKTILIDNNVIRSKDIKFIDFNPSNDSELMMSIDVNGNVSSPINGLYVSPNRGGTWNKLKFTAYDNKTDLIFDSVSKYGNNIFYFNANDGVNNSYVLTNNNGILGSTVNGFYYSEDFWISSTSDGITFYVADTTTETNEFDYKFYTFPLDYWASNPTCLHYVGNVLAVGSSKGIDFYTVTIINGTVSLSNHIRISDGLISTSVSKIIDNGTQHIVATSQGITLIPFIGYQTTTSYVSIDISSITNGNRSNSIIDVDYDSELNRIVFISKDSIYIREGNGDIKYINSENSSLNEQTLSAVAIKQTPFYSIDYDTGEIEFSRIPTNIFDLQEIVVVKTITRISVEPPVSEATYINSIQGTVVSVTTDSDNSSLQIITLDTSLPADYENKIIIIKPDDPLSTLTPILSINTETRSITISVSVKVNIGDKYVLADSLGSTSFIIYSGTDASFIDTSGLRGKDLVYSFYGKDSNGIYVKINTLIINISNSTDYAGIKVTKSPQVFVGSNRGLFYLNSGEFDVSEISSEQPINSLEVDQHGRLLIGTSLDGLYSYVGAGVLKQSVSNSVNDFKIDGIYASSTTSKVIISSNEQITIVDKNLKTIIDEFDSEYSYDEIKFYSDLEIPHLKTFYRSNGIVGINSIVDPDDEVHVFPNKNTSIRTTNSRTELTSNNVTVVNDPKGFYDNILFLNTAEDSVLIGTKSSLYVSTSKDNVFRRTPSTTGTTKYNIVKATLINDDRLYLTTDDYKNKILFIENVSPYSLRPGQSYVSTDIVGSDDKLFNQTIYSVLYNTDGSAIWAGGFGSLYYRATADTEWTEVSYENLSNPFLKYRRLYNSSKSGNPIYAIVEYPNIENSNLIERESNIIKVTNSSGFTLDVVSSGYSFEKDSGRYSLTFSAPVYKDSYFGPNRSKEISLFGDSVSNGIVDFGITSLVEVNDTNNIILGSAHNNLRYLTYPYQYEKDGINKDVSLQIGYRSIDDNLFELSSAHEKGFVSTSPGILEKYKPSRVVNVFESDYDEDLLFVSVFNPGELESIAGKEFFAVSNEKSLDHDHGSLLASRDGGQTWTKIGHNLPVEAIVSDVVDDGDSRIFVSLFGSSTANCGVWYSDNNGRTFSNISRNLPNKPIKTLYYSENVNGYPEFGGVIYVGFWGGGVYKLETSGIGYGYSTYGSLSYGYGYENLDPGASFFDVFGFDFGTEQWAEVEFDIGFKRGKNLTGTNVVDISGFKNEFHESIWVATAEDGVLYSDAKTINTLGSTWTQKNNGLKTNNLTTILASQFNETDVWLGTENGFYKYNTSENKWVLIDNGIPQTINVKTIEHDVHFFSTFIPVTWNNISGSDGTLVLRTPGSVASNSIIDNKTYAKGDIVGSSIVAYVGDADYSVTEYKDIGQNLDVGKEYFYTFFSYLQSGSDITYTRFPNILTGEIASYDTNYPNIINLSTFEATATEVHYIDATNDRHDGETLVILERTTINDIENLLSQKSSVIDGYNLKYTYNGIEYTHVISEPIVEGVFIDGDVTATLISNTIVYISPNLEDDELIGYAINPSISQGRIDGNLIKPILFEITDNTDTTITVRERNDRKTVGSVSDMVTKEYRLGDGTVWNINKVSVRKNGLAYTNDPINPQRVYPVFGPINRGNTYRASNTVTVISDKLLKAQTITPLYIGTSGSGVFRSIDNGNTFVYKCLSGYVINDIEISIENLKDRTLQNADDAVVYISTTTGLFKSEDGGGTVSQIGISTFGSNNVEKMIIEIDGDDETIYVNYPGNGIYFSKNAGTTWSEIESDTSTLDINDIDLSEERSREFILTTSGSGIINYIEPFDEKFNISIVSDDKITSVSDLSLHLGDEIINYKDRILVDSVLRRSSYSNLKSIQFKEDHQNSLEISVKKNNNYIPASDIYIGENSVTAPSNPFRLNKDDDLNYPSHIFDTAFMPNGDIFIATNVGGFISPDGNSWVRSGNYLTPKRIYSIGVLKDDIVVIGTNNGIWRSSDNGETFIKDQLAGNSVRAIWQHNYNGVTKTWYAGDFGLRTIVEGDDVIRISTPETFDNSDGIVFSWGSVDDNGNLQPGGMDEKFLEFLNTRREYWIPGSKNNPLYSTGWSGIVVVRSQDTESNFIPQDDATYREKYRRLVEPPENNIFFESPIIRPFKTGQVVAKLITNTTNVLDESINKFVSGVSIGQNTFNPDNPFIDMVHLTSDYDLSISNKFGGYPEPSGVAIDYAKDYGDYGDGARLLPETTYYYSLYAFFNRPSTTVFYDLKRLDQLLPEYYPVKFDEYSYDLKMRHFTGSTQILCGDSLSLNEIVIGTDNGVFYDSGNGIKQSNLSEVEVTAIKFVETSQKHPILGYGWGYFGQGINYFDVFSISGTLTGYGLRNAGIINRYAYGVGYEYQNVNKIFAGTNDGIYMSLTKGETFSKVFDFSNTEFNVVNNIIVNSNSEVLASTNIGILKKSTTSDLSWTLIDKIIGSADDTSNGRMLGQSFKINEIIRT